MINGLGQIIINVNIKEMQWHGLQMLISVFYSRAKLCIGTAGQLQ